MKTPWSRLRDRLAAWWRHATAGLRADAGRGGGPDARIGWWRRAPRPAAGDHRSPLALTAPPQRFVSVIIPALNEAGRIADVVRHALADPATAEVIVIDDSSINDTAALARAAGALVHTSSMLGKGASMQDGLQHAGQALVAYLDGDLTGLQPGIISMLALPLHSGEADFVKARFGRGGGRVTELTAKPMLKVFFPELAHLAQPLGGVIAARRSLLQTLSFESGYGVDVALVIDAQRAGARVAEVDIGRLEHDSQPLHDLAAMAIEISHVIHARARAAGRLNVDQIARIQEAQRQAAADLDQVLARRRGRQRVLLLGMDGSLLLQPFAEALAAATGRAGALAEIVGHGAADAPDRRERVAALFRFIHRRQFEAVAQAMPIRPGAIEWVNRMRRAGFMVGVVDDGWFVGADIVRQRVFADFALANLLQFDSDVCSGEVRGNPAFMPAGTGAGRRPGPHNVLARLREDPAEPRVETVWAAGHVDTDAALLKGADLAFATGVADAALPPRGLVAFSRFDELLQRVPQAAPEPVSECD
jgi:glucosyl-3-phosphoglycerate synthase